MAEKDKEDGAVMGERLCRLMCGKALPFR